MAKKDTVGALNVLKEGYEKYPEEQTVLEGMIQVYIDLNKTDEAMKYLEMAIAKRSEYCPLQVCARTVI